MYTFAKNDANVIFFFNYFINIIELTTENHEQNN